MRITFKSENEDFEYPEGATVTLEFSSDNLADILTQFGYFLKGAGFELDGEVEIVDKTNDDVWSSDSDDDDWTLEEEDDEETIVVSECCNEEVTIKPKSMVEPFDTMISSPKFNDTLNIKVGEN